MVDGWVRKEIENATQVSQEKERNSKIALKDEWRHYDEASSFKTAQSELITRTSSTCRVMVHLDVFMHMRMYERFVVLLNLRFQDYVFKFTIVFMVLPPCFRIWGCVFGVCHILGFCYCASSTFGAVFPNSLWRCWFRCCFRIRRCRGSESTVAFFSVSLPCYSVCCHGFGFAIGFPQVAVVFFGFLDK